MNRRLFALCLALLTLCRPAPADPAPPPAAAAPAAAVAPAALDPLLLDPTFQYEVLRYVYHWYLDDRFFTEVAKATSFDLWIRPRTPHTRDPGDESRYAEIWLPAAEIQLHLKLADYPVPELQRRVRSPGYRITRVDALEHAPAPREKYTVITLDREKIHEYMIESHDRPDTPDPALRQRLLAAMRVEAKLTPPSKPNAVQTFFLSDMSPVTGELWVVWVNEQAVIRFGGEFGADAPDLLALLPLDTHRYDLKRHVVASLLESEGRTGYMTEDWAGRILYQCIVRGQRVEIPGAALLTDTPLASPAATPAPAAPAGK